jgi:hypothetical protein
VWTFSIGLYLHWHAIFGWIGKSEIFGREEFVIGWQLFFVGEVVDVANNFQVLTAGDF